MGRGPCRDGAGACGSSSNPLPRVGDVRKRGKLLDKVIAIYLGVYCVSGRGDICSAFFQCVNPVRQVLLHYTLDM